MRGKKERPSRSPHLRARNPARRLSNARLSIPAFRAMGAQSPRTPPCTPGKRTRRSRSTPKSEKTDVRQAPPGKAAVAVAVDAFERMATRHVLSLHDASEAKNGLEAAAQVRDTTRDTTALVVPPPRRRTLTSFPPFFSLRAAGRARRVVGVRLGVFRRVRRRRRGERRVRVPRDAPRRLRAPRRRGLHAEAKNRGRTRRRRHEKKRGGGEDAAPRGSRLSASRRRVRPRRRGSRRRRVRFPACHSLPGRRGGPGERRRCEKRRKASDHQL